MRQALAVAVALACWLSATAALGRDLSDYKRPEVARAIARLTQEAIWARAGAKPFVMPRVPDALDRPAGVFVTLSRNGVTRGCWGTVQPRAGSLAAELVANAVKALSHDYRQRPIQPHELDGLVAHVSILDTLTPAFGPQELQPRRLGLLVAGHGKGGVLLPGEAATARWQIDTCRHKAGLRPRERASMYTFETAVVGPISLTPPADR